MITQDSGRKVLVVQAYAFGKYLGLLETTFDANGELLRWQGNPILLDNTVEQGKLTFFSHNVNVYHAQKTRQENIEHTQKKSSD